MNSLPQLIIDKTKQKFNQAYRNKFKNDTVPYTVISSISLYHIIEQEIEIISIGFGTKVLPLEISKKNKGKVVKDMHGQMMAKNGFCKFILQNLPQKNEQNKYFLWDKKLQKHFLRLHFEIILYSSQNFCGDCMIDKELDSFSGAKPLKYFNLLEFPNSKFEDNILRTKPGRLDIPQQKKALSLSCSDKIGIWNILGIQGKELFKVIKPIYIDKIIVQVVKETNQERIKKGINLVQRISLLKGVQQSLVKRKLFNIVIDKQQRKITNQFRHNTPLLIKVIKEKEQNKKGFDLCGVIVDKNVEWINGKTGLPEGVSLSSKSKKVRLSEVCTQKLYKGIEGEIWKYGAVKDRIKKLFGEWTQNYKAQQNAEKCIQR